MEREEERGGEMWLLTSSHCPLGIQCLLSTCTLTAPRLSSGLRIRITLSAQPRSGTPGVRWGGLKFSAPPGLHSLSACHLLLCLSGA